MTDFPTRVSNPNAATSQSSWYSILTPLVRGWRLLLGAMLLAGAITATYILLSPRKYRATMSLSTVFNPRMAIGSGGLGALLNGTGSMGLQATPPLIVLLAGQYGVLTRVVHAPLRSATPETIGQRLVAVRGRNYPEQELPLELEKIFSSGVDKQTGVITISALSTDSVLARAVARELVAEISRTFIRSSKSQATGLRQAMQARVDSAANQLRRADEEFRYFTAANRVVSPFSEAALQRENLDRTKALAHTIYTQAVTDRESAVSRELEETPAVVVLDSLPRELLREPRRTAMTSVIASLAAFLFASMLLLVREGVQQSGDSDDMAEFTRAIQSVPFLGPMLAWVLGLRGGRVRPPNPPLRKS